MVDLKDKDYVAIVQCHIVKERCSGYNCERAFNVCEDTFVDERSEKLRKAGLYAASD